MTRTTATHTTPSVSDIAFAPASTAPSLSSLIRDLKRSSLAPHNRLRSIRGDAVFVGRVSSAFARPLIANERCGSWYVDPAKKAGSAYFKSTDGHTGVWKFSLRRLNLHLLDIIEANDGCVVVDSTRRGKRMPDALSKTIPIWCATLNTIIFPEIPASHIAHTPPNVVSPSEHDSIASFIPAFADSFRALDINVAALRSRISKPLRPVWITRDSALPDGIEDQSRVIFDDYRPVICCTASRRAGSEIGEGGYVQGAADDTENWAMGLTAPLFWEHADELLGSPEADLPERIASLVEKHQETRSDDGCFVEVGPDMFVCPLPLQTKPNELEHQLCLLSDTTTDRVTWIKSPRRMEVGLGKHKIASRTLRHALLDIVAWLKASLGTESPLSDPLPRLVIACESGKDLSVGAALAITCWKSQHARPATRMSKDTINIKRASIMMAFPGANPSRATLQSVNSFLMNQG